MEDRVRAPRWLAEHAEAFRASGAVPAVPRLAATVVLLRPAPAGYEVYVQRRAATMAFGAGMYAFPGGSVDAGDYSSDDSDIERDMSALRRAAARELVEEAGVQLDPGALAPWARWITPEFEPRRFDTYFFVAAVPAGQTTVAESGEADHAAWLAPAAALHLPMLPPTRFTIAELTTLPDIDAVLAAARTRDCTTAVRPVVEVDPDGVWLRLVT